MKEKGVLGKQATDLSLDLRKAFKIACESESTVLVTGGTGTGKSLLAKRIHDSGRRAGKPFVLVNLACLHEGTLESELFGHERGAFTGADQKRVGRLEAAQGGTVFLDEVGELSLRLQARLLEFLQSHTISPVGGNREIKLDVRVIAATHKNLFEEVSKGTFREDLFHRLRIVSLYLKPLKDRGQLKEIAQTCLSDLSTKNGRKGGVDLPVIDDFVWQRFEAYHWPGNIRELRNVLEYALLSSQGSPVISLEDLPLWFEGEPKAQEERLLREGAVFGTMELPLTADFNGTVAYLEKEYISRALSRNFGRIGRTARQIGMNKTTLLRRIRAHRISIVRA